MKRKILITACYILDAEKDAFWDRDTGYLTDAADKCLKNAFPEKMDFPEGPAAVRYSVSHQLIDCPQYNSLVCPICGRALTDPSKPNPIHGLDKCVTVEGVGLCGGCAYQLDAEMKRDGVEAVLKKYKKET